MIYVYFDSHHLDLTPSIVFFTEVKETSSHIMNQMRH